jgi:hypothetical protein
MDVDELRWHWGDAYIIHGEPDKYTATRRDNGWTLRAETPLELYALIRRDYQLAPVPRQRERRASR